SYPTAERRCPADQPPAKASAVLDSVLHDLGERAVVAIEVDPAEGGRQWNRKVGAAGGDGQDDLHVPLVGVRHRDGEWNVEQLADLIDMDQERLTLRARIHAIGPLEPRQRGAVDPPLEKALQRTFGGRLHGLAEHVGAGFLESRYSV